MSDNLRMVCIFREDVPLPKGKMSGQAGHAFLTVWRQAYKTNPDMAEDYAENGQTKIVLLAPDLVTLQKIAAKATSKGVSNAFITDAAKTVLKVPTITVLGLGPMTKTQSNNLTRGLKKFEEPED